jgi:glycosyltransferase involved in cell wall biosynthesis
VIKDRCNEEQPVRLLYISQGLRFLSKGALEIVDAFKKLRSSGCTNVTLTMVTSLSEVDLSILNEIKQIKGISLCDFTFTGNDILKLYATHNIYLMPTSDDSFNITVLEAIKAGLPIVGTSLYAIPEMVQDNYNGYLTEPAYYFFDKNNVPNPEVWNHRDSTIYSGTRCGRITNFLFDKENILPFTTNTSSPSSLVTVELPLKDTNLFLIINFII